MKILGTYLIEEPVTYRVTPRSAQFAKIGTIAGIDVNSLVTLPSKPNPA